MRFLYTTFIVSIALATTAFTQQPQKTPDSSIQVGLPQRPIAPKERSDLDDQGIKGKVQTIKFETESSSGANAGKGRRLNRIEEFNEAGNKVSTSYVRDEVVTSILYYGYIDGTRVSKSDGRSGGSGSGIGSGQVDTKPRDNRYDLKRLYEYRNGKLIKETLISNDGSLTLTREYNHRDGETEELVYDKNGKLNQKYITKFDKDGNEIEFNRFDVWKDPNKVAQKSRYTYGSFDSTGNWTQMSVSFAAGDSDKFSQGDSIYRIITYYSDDKRTLRYPSIWFAPINDPNKPDWEILPQEAKAGEVILSKRQ